MKKNPKNKVRADLKGEKKPKPVGKHKRLIITKICVLELWNENHPK